MLHFPPCLSKQGERSPVSEKSPVAAMVSRIPPSTLLPVTATVFVILVPTVCAGNTSNAGLNVNCPTWVAENPITCGLDGSLSVMLLATGCRYCNTLVHP